MFSKQVLFRGDETGMAAFFQPGDRLGMYVIERCLGFGGTGEVYRVYHEQLKVYRAMKILIPERLQAAPGLVERLLQEARVTASIRHPNIVDMLDIGTDEVTGIPYLIMEYVDGGSLFQYLRGGN